LLIKQQDSFSPSPNTIAQLNKLAWLKTAG